MDLSPDRQAAARALGLALLPATDEQVGRLTVQRRVFRIGGRPFLATRGGGYFETHATLAAMIGPDLSEPVVPGVTPEAPPAAAPVTPAEEQPPEQTAGTTPSARSSTARPVEEESEAASDRRRKPRTRRGEPTPTAAPPAGAARSEDAPSAAEEIAAAVEAAPRRGLAVARCPAGQPKTPRWMVAGKLRRGRPR